MRIFSLLFFLALSAVAFAANGDDGSLASFFSLSSSDQSVVFLSQIFGEVGGVLPGNYGLLGHMFERFNEVMIVLNTIVVGYAAMFGLVSTAHEGEFLGKKFSSIWVPIRAVAGIGLLIPTASGYCILQIVMMWIVLQGAGAADDVWNVVLKFVYAQSKGTPIVAGGTDKNSAQVQTQLAMEKVLLGLVCMQMYDMSTGPNPNPTPGQAPQGIESADQTSYQWAFTPTGMGTGDCGSLSVPNPTSAKIGKNSPQYYQANALVGNPSSSSGGGVSPVPSPGGSIAPASSVMQMVIEALNNAAIQIVANCFYNGVGPFNPPGPNSGCNITGSPISTAGDAVVSALESGMQAYFNSSATSPSGKLGLAERYGWIFAGAFYYDLSYSYNNSGLDQAYLMLNASGPTANNPALPQPYQSDLLQYLVINNPQIPSAVQNLTEVQFNNSMFYGTSRNGEALGGAFNVLTGWIVGLFIQMTTYGNGDIVDGQFIHGDPILGLQLLGERMVNWVEFFWFLALIILIGITTIGTICGGINPMLPAAIIATKAMTGIIIFFGVLLTAGLTLSVYIPLIPYIIFLFGALGWLLAVVETMLAAPMVAMGLTHPEGHEVYGRAEPAIMLITNVFTRPTLMIFGLISGMLLARVGLSFLNATYNFVMISDAQINVKIAVNKRGIVPSGTEDTSGYGIGPFELILYIITYVSLCIVIVNKCFSLISTIPDAVLRWIGNQHQFGEYMQGEQQVAGMAKEGAQTTGQKASEAAQGASDTATALEESRGEAKEKQEKKAHQDAMLNALQGVGGNSTRSGGDGAGGGA